MNLHEHSEDFEELIAIVADYIGVPADAVRRDYYIVQLMQNLQNSEYAETCVFKGGTSLSKCYPGSIFKEKYEGVYSGISRRKRYAGCRD